MNNVGYVLLSGAGLGASIWGETTQFLDKPFVCIEAPERGNSNTSVKLSFDDYINNALRQIETLKADKIVLVGHSIGGVVMMRLSELLKDRVVGMVAVSAAIPTPSGSFLSCLPQPKRFIMGMVLRLAGTAVPESAIRSGLCNDLTPEQTQKIVDGFTPESRALYLTPVDYTLRSIPAHYIITTDDHEFDATLQRQMAQRIGAETSEIASGHLPMIRLPKQIAQTITTFAQGI